MSTLTAIAPIPPRPTVWTVQRFHDVREAGHCDGRRAILIRGTVWELGPMNPPHATAVSLAVEALRSAFGTGFHPRVQLPLVLSLDTDPFPDVAIVTGTARDYAVTHPTTAALVLEVADTSLDFDTTVKAELYATAGIADYWVLDLEGRRLLVFRDPTSLPPGGVAYRTQHVYGPADSVAPLAAPHSPIRVGDLLP
jgi:hypothetical protein